MATTKKIKLTDLQVNTENYRFEPVSSQKEAIDKMVDDQGEKLFHLAEHIVINGLNPNDRIQAVVSSHDSAKFNIVEGNRRIVTLKLLNNPDLIDHSKHTSLKKKFRKLHDDNGSALINAIECTVYDNPTEADKWIKLKHAGQLDGIGTVTWTAQQVDRFEEKVEGKSSIALQTIKLLEKSKDVSVDIINCSPSLDNLLTKSKRPERTPAKAFYKPMIDAVYEYCKIPYTTLFSHIIQLHHRRVPNRFFHTLYFAKIVQ
jgi:hypothetical protein